MLPVLRKQAWQGRPKVGLCIRPDPAMHCAARATWRSHLNTSRLTCRAGCPSTWRWRRQLWSTHPAECCVAGEINKCSLCNQMDELNNRILREKACLKDYKMYKHVLLPTNLKRNHNFWQSRWWHVCLWREAGEWYSWVQSGRPGVAGRADRPPTPCWTPFPSQWNGADCLLRGSWWGRRKGRGVRGLISYF